MSWREADDPRCPECGGKIAATAYYCMHCSADLPGDAATATEARPDDDILTDDPDSSWRTDDADGGDSGGSSVSATIREAAAQQRARDVATGSSLGGMFEDRHKVDGVAGRIASMLFTDVPEPEGVPPDRFTAPLWMRVPLAFVAGVFVFIVTGIVSAMAFGNFLGPLGGTAIFVLFLAILVWLTRKPLPSDIVADSCYAIALALLLMPTAFVVDELVSGVDSTNDLLVGAAMMQFGLLFPASFLLVIGYAGNRYARAKLDSIAESAAGE